MKQELYQLILWAVVFGIVLVGLAYCVPAQAQEATIPIKANVVQCGPREDMAEMCATEPRCCVFIEPASGNEPLEPLKGDCELWLDEQGAIPVCVLNVE